MKILYLSSHAVLEYDQTKLWTELGYDVFSIGAYTDPAHPTVDLRPAIDAPAHPDLADLCHEQRVRHVAESSDYPIIDWAKAELAQGVIDWADTIIVDCYPESWIVGNWPRIWDKRVIWRTIGQSGYETEALMKRLPRLEIVRYSPKERNLPSFAGETELIRFGKDPNDWFGWTGDEIAVGNLAQHDAIPHARDAFLNWSYFEAATAGLPVSFGGPHSELIGGLGALAYEEMRAYLRRIRVYLYTGTQPASYTLGLIEALMTGTPVVSIGAGRMWAPELFEGYPFCTDGGYGYEDPATARKAVERHLAETSPSHLLTTTTLTRDIALRNFSTEIIGRQWAEFLGAPVRAMVAA